MANTGQGEAHYFRSLWYEPDLSSRGCAYRAPYMVGGGGNAVILLPNGMTAIRIAGGRWEDSATWNRIPMRQLADAIRPICQPRAHPTPVHPKL